jgi:integrase
LARQSCAPGVRRPYSAHEAVATRCAHLHIPDGRNEADALIAATALVHDLIVVTRNIRDFEGTGVIVVDPWHGSRSRFWEIKRGLKFSGHSLRAGVASSAEVDEHYVQKQLGHASAEMTRRYQRRRDRFRVNLTKAAGL